MEGDDALAFVPAAAWPVGHGPGLWFAFRGGDLLVLDGDRVPRVASLEGLGLTAVRVQRLGQLRGEVCFSAELAPDASAPAGAAFRSLRELVGVFEPELAKVAKRAVQIKEWDRTHQFCGACGTPTTPDPRTRARACGNPACKLAQYPRLSPAVIVAVERGPELLLARSPHFPAGMFSVLAGFVDPGESAEDAVHREVFEEVGLRVANVRYFGSQSWPFPHSLMLGFQADYAGGTLTPDPEEIEAAGFYRADTLPPVRPGLISIAQWLIQDFRARRS
jgi:NAD+ diphosphatase